ncbi:hypothetical protein VHEMI09336 [[Torrubiella] hemipterigena]|uniref:Uncharacterized protein n=1 Tax=[Torrubiella] hemipterigena TaxID=1531966 RepID=A0A0A1TRC5_9HYPO|nr:hypothetical protein VHEMI09336 [[Torrubiella] hemipterigena]
MGYFDSITWGSGAIGTLLALVISITSILAFVRQSQRRKTAQGQEAQNNAPIKKEISRPKCWRIRGVPVTWSRNDLALYLEEHCSTASIIIKSLAVELEGNSYTAIATCRGDFPRELRLPLANETARPEYLTFDSHFRGITTLYAPKRREVKINVIAMHGLGGHAFGSFKERGGDHMWLLDSLPDDLIDPQTTRPMARILVYGHESAVENSSLFQDLEDVALSFREALLRLSSTLPVAPIMLIGHSFGGLIAKQALISMLPSATDKYNMYKPILRAMRAVVFFAVPHDGMDIEGLREAAGNRLNRFLIETLSDKNSSVLRRLRRNFDGLLDRFDKVDIFCFYEMSISATPLMNEGSGMRMNGPKKVLVSKTSAIHIRTSDHSDDFICGITRDHSHIVKFARGDEEYEKVRTRLRRMAQNIVSAKFTTDRAELHEAVRSNNTSEATRLLDDGAAIDVKNDDNLTPLLVATFYTRSIPMMELLLDEGADINAADYRNSVAMHEAVKRRDKEMIRVLLQHSPDLTIRDFWGNSPFHLGVNAPPEVLGLILEMQPDSDRAENIEHRTGDNGTTSAQCTPLQLTAYRAEWDLSEDKDFAFEKGALCARLLLEHGALINACGLKDGQTTLHKAVASGNMPLTTVLLEFGADPHVVDNSGHTPTSQPDVDAEIKLLVDEYSENFGIN